MASAAPQVDLPERKYLGSLIRSLSPKTPVVLVGSWARGTTIPEASDVDVLVVSKEPTPKSPADIQLIFLPEMRLRERLEGGDDFPQWALRFGVPLSGRTRWSELRTVLLRNAPWPSAEKKLEQARSKLAATNDLLAMGDIAAAEEELRFALSHLARAMLLSRHVFPLSRPELADQLANTGFPRLARYQRRLTIPKQLTEKDVHLLQSAAQRHLTRLTREPRDGTGGS